MYINITCYAGGCTSSTTIVPPTNWVFYFLCLKNALTASNHFWKGNLLGFLKCLQRSFYWIVYNVISVEIIGLDASYSQVYIVILEHALQRGAERAAITLLMRAIYVNVSVYSEFSHLKSLVGRRRTVCMNVNFWLTDCLVGQPVEMPDTRR